jgi:iron complex transport system substrate-binding protein
MQAFASLLAASAAVRAASLNLCTDEYLLLLARPTEIVSVSRLSHDRGDSPLWRTARRYPANGGNLEGTLQHRPSLLLTMGGGGRASKLIAGRLGIKVLDLPFPTGVEDVGTNMVRVARALGDPGRADAWRNRLQRLRRAPVPNVDAIYLGAGGSSLASDSLGARWMALAGFRQRTLPGARASLETLAVSPPEVLLRSNYRHSQPSLGQSWLAHPIVRHVRSKILGTDGRRWTCAGPLMVAEVERLRALR